MSSSRKMMTPPPKGPGSSKNAAPSSSSTTTPGGGRRSTPRRSKSARSPITSEAEREQALRDYKVTIEYKHLKQHAPGGVYVIPSLTNLRIHHGVIFLRRGLYHNGIFKFTITLPDKYNDHDTWPQIVFTSHVYNPHVDAETGELDLRSAYPAWDPHRHYLVTVLTYLKKIFYMRPPFVSSGGEEGNVANPEAKELAQTDPPAFRKKIESCVRESQRSVYVNDPGCTAKFTEETGRHEILRELMRKKFVGGGDGKEGGAVVSRGHILDCIVRAQVSSKGAEDGVVKTEGDKQGLGF